MTMWDLHDRARQEESDSARIAVQRIITGKDTEFFILDAGYQRAVRHDIYATIQDLRPALEERHRERRLRNAKKYGWTYCQKDDRGYECGLKLDDGRCVIHGDANPQTPT